MINPRLESFIHGYAQLLDAPVEKFFAADSTLITTSVRDLPEWANWIQPAWLFAFKDALICSVSPTYAEVAEAHLADVSADVLLSDATLARAMTVVPDLEWVRCELFYYPHRDPPQLIHKYKVEELRAGHLGAEKHLRNFDGGVYVIRSPSDEITTAAFIKNKGLIREIAVGTEVEYRRQGRGQAVVAHAIQEILAQGYVPTYWPDSFDNRGSYALAQSVGLIKVAEMLFCAYEQPEWQGFEAF